MLLAITNMLSIFSRNFKDSLIRTIKLLQDKKILKYLVARKTHKYNKLGKKYSKSTIMNPFKINKKWMLILKELLTVKEILKHRKKNLS